MLLPILIFNFTLEITKLLGQRSVYLSARIYIPLIKWYTREIRKQVHLRFGRGLRSNSFTRNASKFAFN